MKPVELYARVRYACQVEGLSQRETARRFALVRSYTVEAITALARAFG